MNDRSLACLLAQLDAELARKSDPTTAADQIMGRVEERVPGSVLRTAAAIQLRSLGCPVAAR